METLGLIALIVVALGFDYTNGFHDAANAIATSVSTRALTPRNALMLAAVFNLFGSLVSTKIADTVGGIISAPDTTEGLTVVFAAVVGATIWNLITWYFGLPSSSSHALIGGLCGAAIASSGHVKWNAVLQKVIIPMVVSPVVGFVLAFVLMIGVLWAFRRANPRNANVGFRMGQWVSSAAMAFGHGLQDAQKTMGVITLALVVTHHLSVFDQCGYGVGRLAHHAHARAPGVQARQLLGLCRAVGGVRGVADVGVRLCRTDLDDTRDHVVGHGRRGHEEAVGGAMGRCRQHPAGVGADASGRGIDGGSRIRAGPPRDQVISRGPSPV